jgi:hypothetical protein
MATRLFVGNVLKNWMELCTSIIYKELWKCNWQQATHHNVVISPDAVAHENLNFLTFPRTDDKWVWLHWYMVKQIAFQDRYLLGYLRTATSIGKLRIGMFYGVFRITTFHGVFRISMFLIGMQMALLLNQYLSWRLVTKWKIQCNLKLYILL